MCSGFCFTGYHYTVIAVFYMSKIYCQNWYLCMWTF